MPEAVNLFKEGYIVIDGTNIAFLLHDHRKIRGPKLDPVLQSIQCLIATGIPADRIITYFEHYDRRHFSEVEYERLWSLARQDGFQILPAGRRFIVAVMQLGEKCQHKFLIISNDLFRDAPRWFQAHRIGVGLDPEDHPYLQIPSKESLIHAFNGEIHGKLEVCKTWQRKKAKG